VITPSPEDEAALDATKAPLMEHLVELRTRLIWSVVSFGICFGISFAFAKQIFEFLIAPLHHATNHMIYTALTEVFFTYVKIGMFGGICLGFPVIAAQIWIFVAPGLFLLWTPVLFTMGAAFVYYIMLPFSITFFGGYQVPATSTAMGVQLQAKVSDYLDFVMTLMFAFGLTFQLPVLLSLLAKVGIVSAKSLREMRRYAIVALFAVAAIFTPPDAISMMSLAVPLVLLYEISILSVVMIERGRAKEEAARAAKDAAEAAKDLTPPV
jgi:sec-independent protein translocase protein TatC